ncbi:helix-turn-helix transcriptional regulator [Exiguobacterium sp. SL14]|nr:helix-turn-helix transcriptional regulator [Exiguobacterium sp. SL14]MCY1691626.1 helix-turn-helix transcriptional regulator [Exiguobacterium sp. SL14]
MSGNIARSLRQRRYLYQLLEQLSERRQEQTFEEVTSLWLEELGKSGTVSDLASELNMSLPTFSRQFKKYYNQSPKELMHQLRMQRAKEWMIAHPDWTIAKIAERIAINDEFYFSRLFKKREGVSPRQYQTVDSTRRNLESGIVTRSLIGTWHSIGHRTIFSDAISFERCARLFKRNRRYATL